MGNLSERCLQFSVLSFEFFCKSKIMKKQPHPILKSLKKFCGYAFNLSHSEVNLFQLDFDLIWYFNYVKHVHSSHVKTAINTIQRGLAFIPKLSLPVGNYWY